MFQTTATLQRHMELKVALMEEDSWEAKVAAVLLVERSVKESHTTAQRR